MDLGQHVLCPYYGSGEQGRKKCQEEGIFHQVAARLERAAIDIDNVRYGTESKEGYACGSITETGSNPRPIMEVKASARRLKYLNQTSIPDIREHIYGHDGFTPQRNPHKPEKTPEKIIACAYHDEYKAVLSARFIIEIERKGYNDRHLQSGGGRKAAGLLRARSASTLRLISMPALWIRPMSLGSWRSS